MTAISPSSHRAQFGHFSDLLVFWGSPQWLQSVANQGHNSLLEVGSQTTQISIKPSMNFLLFLCFMTWLLVGAESKDKIQARLFYRESCLFLLPLSQPCAGMVKAGTLYFITKLQQISEGKKEKGEQSPKLENQWLNHGGPCACFATYILTLHLCRHWCGPCARRHGNLECIPYFLHGYWKSSEDSKQWWLHNVKVLEATELYT